jgi:hypothetical protein
MGEENKLHFLHYKDMRNIPKILLEVLSLDVHILKHFAFDMRIRAVTHHGSRSPNL